MWFRKTNAIHKNGDDTKWQTSETTGRLLFICSFFVSTSWNVIKVDAFGTFSNQVNSKLITRSAPQTKMSHLFVSSRSRKRRPSWDTDDEYDDFLDDSSDHQQQSRVYGENEINHKIIQLQHKPEWEHRKQDSIKCEHFDTCPGCTLDKQITTVPAVQSARLFFSSASIQRHTVYPGSSNPADFFKVIVPSSITQWRTQAKLAVAPKSKWGRDGCVFGLYERGTHKVTPIPSCQVHHPNINLAVELLTKATANIRTASYEESTGQGDLRYVQLQVERITGKVCLTLVWNAEQLKSCQPGLARLVKELKRLDPKMWHSIWCHCNSGLGNNIFSRGEGRWHQMDGPEFIREPLPQIIEDNGDEMRKDGLLFFNPMSFRQGNMDGFDAIAEHVAKGVPPNSAVCELYAGVGLLGLTALSYAHNSPQNKFTDASMRWLRCSDENPANPRCFNRAVGSMPSEVTGRPKRSFDKNKKKNKKNSKYTTLNNMVDKNKQRGRRQDNTGNASGSGEKVTYMVASATKALLSGQALGAEVLIVDPPRKGLDEEVVAQLCKPFNSNQPPVEDKRLVFGPSHTTNWVNDVTTLIYVSCGFDALARDTDAILSANAGWKLVSATGYVLFPGSNHLETVAIFRRDGREEDDNY